jgi:hypothetical protein
VGVAEYAWAFAEVGAFVLVDLGELLARVRRRLLVAYHFRQTSSSDDVASVYKAVEVAGRFLDLFAHVIFTVEVEDIRHKVERVLIVLDLGVEASQIETVGQVFFVNLAEVFVASRGDELCGEKD